MIHRPHPGLITVIREVKSAYKERVGGGGHNCGEQKTQIQSSNYAKHAYVYTYVSHVDWKVVTASLICCLT